MNFGQSELGQKPKQKKSNITKIKALEKKKIKPTRLMFSDLIIEILKGREGNEIGKKLFKIYEVKM